MVKMVNSSGLGQLIDKSNGSLGGTVNSFDFNNSNSVNIEATSSNNSGEIFDLDELNTSDGEQVDVYDEAAEKYKNQIRDNMDKLLTEEEKEYFDIDKFLEDMNIEEKLKNDMKDNNITELPEDYIAALTISLVKKARRDMRTGGMSSNTKDPGLTPMSEEDMERMRQLEEEGKIKHAN